MNLKCCPPVWPGIDTDQSLMTFDNSIGGGKAQAGSFTDRFGGKKRIKTFFDGLPIHTLAGIGDRHNNSSSSFLLPSYNQLAAIRHRIPGICAKIHQGLAKAGGISHDRQLCREIGLNLYFLVK